MDTITVARGVPSENRIWDVWHKHKRPNGEAKWLMVRKELPRSRSASLDSVELKDNGPMTTSIAPSAYYIGSAASLGWIGRVWAASPPIPKPEDKSRGTEIASDGWNG